MTNDASGNARPPTPLWQRALLWLITILCFVWLYTRIDAAAARQGASAASYLLQVFASVSWGTWLALMIPYSVFFFLVDSTVVWRVVTWFNARVPWKGILPIRASAYIISIVNEQVGKGAMALYLNRRDGVPGWEVGSSMLFIMFCELLYLTFWANVGYLLAADTLPAVFGLVPWIGLGVLLLFILWGRLFPAESSPWARALRERSILKAFREASPLPLRPSSPRSALPPCSGPSSVYTLALRLFGVEASFVDMLGVLPVDLLRGRDSYPDARRRPHHLGGAVPRQLGAALRLRAGVCTTSSSFSTRRSACCSCGAPTGSCSDRDLNRKEILMKTCIAATFSAGLSHGSPGVGFGRGGRRFGRGRRCFGMTAPERAGPR